MLIPFMLMNDEEDNGFIQADEGGSKKKTEVGGEGNDIKLFLLIILSRLTIPSGKKTKNGFKKKCISYMIILQFFLNCLYLKLLSERRKILF